MADNSKGIRRMLGMSLHGWENSMVVFLIVAGFFALLAGAATWAVVRLQRIELEAARQAFESYKLDAGKKISESNARALEAKLALEKFKEPRSLSPDAQKRIVEKLSGFSGTEFDMATLNDKEPLNILEQIENSLLLAGWRALSWDAHSVLSRTNKPNVGMAVEVGISVQVALPKDEGLFAKAKSLAEALSAEGVDARLEFSGPNITSPNKNAIHIAVGRKP